MPAHEFVRIHVSFIWKHLNGHMMSKFTVYVGLIRILKHTGPCDYIKLTVAALLNGRPMQTLSHLLNNGKYT